MRSAVRSPLRSSSALVATVVPIFTAAIDARRDGRAVRHADQPADAGDRRIGIGLRVFREQLGDPDFARRVARHHVGEGAAAVDPEIPFACGGVGQAARLPFLPVMTGTSAVPASRPVRTVALGMPRFGR